MDSEIKKNSVKPGMILMIKRTAILSKLILIVGLS